MTLPITSLTVEKSVRDRLKAFQQDRELGDYNEAVQALLDEVET